MSFVHIDTFTLDRCFPTNSEREREREKENCQLISWERERERMTINTYIYKERTTIHFVHCIETESCYRFCKMFFSLLYHFQLYSQQLRCFYHIGGHQRHYKLVFGEHDQYLRHGYLSNHKSKLKMVRKNTKSSTNSISYSNSRSYSFNFTNSFVCFDSTFGYQRHSLVNSSASTSIIQFTFILINLYYSYIFMSISYDLFRLANNKRLYESNSNILFILSCSHHYSLSFININ